MCFITRFGILKKQPPQVFLKNSQNWKESIRVFNMVYFSTSVNISLQHSIYQVIFLNLTKKNSHCFSAFFPFPLITISFVHRRFLILLRHWDQNKQKKPRFFQPPCLLYFTEFSDPHRPPPSTSICLLRLPPFIRDLKVFLKHFAYLI